MSVFSSTVESYFMQQHPPPSTIATMTSALQATVSDLSAAVPSLTQTRYNSQFAQMHASFNHLLAQPQTSSSALSAQVQSSPDPLVAQAQGSSGLPLTQAQGAMVIQPVQNQVSALQHWKHSLVVIMVPSLAQHHSGPGLHPAQMPFAYGMQAVPVLGSVRGQPAQIPDIAGLVPTQFQTSYSEQPLAVEMSNLQPMPRIQRAPQLPSAPIGEAGKFSVNL